MIIQNIQTLKLFPIFCLVFLIFPLFSFCFDFASSRKYIFFTFFVLLALFFSFVYLVCVMQLCGFLLTQGLTLQVFSPRKFYKLLSIFNKYSVNIGSVELTGPK